MIADQASGSSSMAEYIEQGAGWPWTSPRTIGSATPEERVLVDRQDYGWRSASVG